jgi:arabinofuranosyltransferase
MRAVLGPVAAGVEEAPQVTRSTARRVLQAIVLAAPVGAFMAAGWAHRWIVDDGFIYLRVVQQVTSRNGPVFNEGERVEAFTSPLWLAILTIADVVTPVRLEWLAIGAGVGLSGAAIVLVMAGARLLVRRHEPRGLLIPFGAVVFMALVASWTFETSGLEIGLVFAWLGGCWFVLARWAVSPARMPTLAAVVLGLGWLVRPELTIFSGVFLVVVLAVEWRSGGRRDALRIAAAAAALPLAYQVFRMGYYGSLVANPAVAKESSSTNWDRGWDYLVDFGEPYWLWVPAIILVLGGYVPLVAGLRAVRAFRALAVIGMFLLAGLLDTAYITSVGGDWMHARLLLPALFVFVAPVAVIPTTRRYVVGLALVPWAFLATFVLRPPQLDAGASVASQFVLTSPGKVVVEDFGWGPEGPRQAWYAGEAFYYSNGLAVDFRRVDLDTKPGYPLPTVALGGIGVASYAIGPEIHVIDLHGLSDTLAAHMISTPSMTYLERKPGHEKVLPSVWLAALMTPDGTRPDPSDFPAPPNPLITPTKGVEFQEQVAWARAALQCPEISGLISSTDAPLTPKRFASNILHSFERTRLRIPPDPEEAYHDFCGSGTPPAVRAVRR